MDIPTISIIVPVYNAERFIEGCVRSLLSQSFNDFEIILVDDGSTDRSGVLCDELAASDGRIIVSHQENNGVSSARNAGIDKASGKYLVFVDADDCIQPNMYSAMVEKAEESDADYMICGYTEVSGNNYKEVLFDLPDGELMDRSGVVNRLLYSIYSNEYIINAPWNKLYKREIIERYQIRFPDRRRAEDWLFNIRYLEKASSAMYINKPLYDYVRNDRSAMSKVFPEQYTFWKENFQIRREIAKKYQLDVDWKQVDTQFVSNVIPWIIAMSGEGRYYQINSVFGDEVFIAACKNSYSLQGRRVECVRKLLSRSLFRIACLLCRI